MLPQLLVAIHVLANLIWIGTVAALGWLLARYAARPERDGDLLGSDALELYQKVANPAFFVSFAAGLCRVLLDPMLFMKQHWFHGKLLFAFIVIGLHHVVGAKAKKAANGGRQEGAKGGKVALATILAAAVVVAFAVFKLPQ